MQQTKIAISRVTILFFPKNCGNLEPQKIGIKIISGSRKKLYPV
jgi:hypothetical protein